jgi:hypothetical protein
VTVAAVRRPDSQLPQFRTAVLSIRPSTQPARHRSLAENGVPLQLRRWSREAPRCRCEEWAAAWRIGDP